MTLSFSSVHNIKVKKEKYKSTNSNASPMEIQKFVILFSFLKLCLADFPIALRFFLLFFSQNENLKKSFFIWFSV
jgi:hypothetical protein